MAKQPKDQENSEVIDHPDDIVKVLARKLQAARMRAGLTQTQLGARAGLKQSYIFELEYGSTNITIRTLEKMAKALDLDVHDLLPDPINRPGSPEELGKIIDDIAQLSILAMTQLSQLKGQLVQEAERHAKEKERIEASIALFEGLKKVASVRHSLSQYFAQTEGK